MIKKCIYCEKEFETKRENAKFCSYGCYWNWLGEHQKENSKKISEWTKKGMAKSEIKEKMRKAKLGKPRSGDPKKWKLSENAKEKLRKAHKGKHHSVRTEFKKGLVPWNKGTRGVMRSNSGSFKQGQTSGEKNNNWKGGISPENERVRRNMDYYNWRRSVYKRDHWICQKCKKQRKTLNAHHIENFAIKKELRFKVSNGITFCKECHDKFHKIYGYRNNNQEQLKEFLYETNISEKERE